MALQPVLLLNTILPSSVAQVDPTKYRTLGGPTVEPNAIGHWLFGSDNPGMADMMTGALMSAAGTAPTQAAGYASLPVAGGSGDNRLLTPIDAAQQQTIACVFRLPALPGGASAFALPLNAGKGNDDASGALLAVGGDGGFASITYIGGNAQAAGDPQTFGAGSIMAGQWCFVAMSHSATQRVISRGAGETDATRAAVLATAAGKKVGVGGISFFGGALDVAELIIFPGVISSADLKLVRLRSVIRLAQRGITAVG